VEVGRIEQTFPLGFNPLLLVERLTLRAMPVAARVVRWVLVAAMLAAFVQVSAECGRAALGDVRQRPPLLGTQVKLTLERSAVLTDDVG
jgi:hypothetical protein